MASPDDGLHDELTRHAAALRGLACALLRDPHAADDVTQATLQQALNQRDLAPGPLGGWLARTLVNFVRQWRRGERRRLRRQAQLPPRAAPCAPADILARREQLRAVTDAVLLLDEPYQTAIFLRYFEDLPPRRIAARTGASVATVKSRLARGLAQLRARLDQQSRDGGPPWRPALLAAFGLPAATALPISAGGLLVSTTTKTLVAMALLGLGGLFAFGRGADPVPAAPGAGASGTAAAATPAAGSSAPAVPGAERAPAAVAPPTAPWLLHPFELRLDVLVVDDTGLPVEGHEITLAPAGCTPNRSPDRTGPDGRASVVFAARTPRLVVDLAEADGRWRRVTLQHGRPTIVALLGRGAGASMVRLHVQGEANRDNWALLGDVPIVTRLSTHGGTAMQPGMHPHAVFGDASALVVAEPPLAFETVQFAELRVGGLGRLRFTARALDLDLGIALPIAPDQPPATAIEGTVFGDDGLAARDTLVVLLGSGPQPLQRARTDDAGRFRFDRVPPGDYHVRAGGLGDGLGTVPATVTDGTTPVVVHLRREACVRGRVLDPDGRPFAAVVEWRADDGSSCDRIECRDDGAFVLANLPRHRGTLLVWGKHEPAPLPLAVVPAVLCDNGEQVVRCDPRPAGALRFEPPAGDRQPTPGFRVWHAESGIGVDVPRGDGPVWSLPGLPAGFYDLDGHQAGSGRRTFGRHWVDGTAPVELGRIEFAAPGHVRFAVADQALPSADRRQCELFALRTDVDLRIEPAPDLERPMQLPAGDYALAFRHADGSLRFTRFAVRAGQPTVVALP